MRAWMLCGVFAFGLAKAHAGDYFYTLVPFENKTAAPVAADQGQHFLSKAASAPQESPKLLPAGYEQAVQPASYCSDVRAMPRANPRYCPPSYDRCPPSCPPAQRTCPPAEPRAAEIRSEPAGVYSAPQPTGEVSGPSNAIGLRGLSIQFPAFRLELPTIQFPCLVRYRRGPQMRLDEAVATYTTEEPMLYGQLLTRREVIQETPAVRHVEVEQPAAATIRSAPTEPCASLQTSCNPREELLQRLLRQAQNQAAAKPKASSNTLSSAQSIEDLNREYQARLQELIKERELQIKRAKEELQMLRLQQGLPGTDGLDGFNTAPPAVPAPK